MKRFFTIIFVAICFAGPISSVQAANGNPERSLFESMYCFFFSCETDRDHLSKDQAWRDYSGATKSVPELDVTGAPIAAALIAGLLGLGLERRRRRR